jgi:hypothetical protein
VLPACELSRNRDDIVVVIQGRPHEMTLASYRIKPNLAQSGLSVANTWHGVVSARD